MDTNTKQKQVEDALIKKAVGYDVVEVVEEYAPNAEQDCQTLVKKKCTTKHFPPDISAIKILLSYYDEKTLEELGNLTDEELYAERDRLIAKLQKFEEKEKM